VSIIARVAPDMWASAMRERLPKETYKALRKTIQDGKPSTEFMKFGDTIRIEVKGKDGASIFGAIDQSIAAP
jgi:glutamine synthetase type III